MKFKQIMARLLAAPNTSTVRSIEKIIIRHEKILIRHLKEQKSISHFINLDAGLATARFVEKHMPNLQPFANRFALLLYALEQVTVNGLFVEFGVHRGKTIRFIAQHCPHQLHGFDSFEGLPEGGGVSLPAGCFDAEGQLPEVPANVTLHEGWFDATLPAFLAAHPEPAAFVHIDCVIYASTHIALEKLAPRLTKGTILVFDEYFNFPSWEQHEYKAFSEMVLQYNLNYAYIGRTDRRQVAVRIE
jgi:hypothetical protein